MNQKLKKELTKVVLSGLVLLCGIGFLLFVVLPSAQNNINDSLYQVGANSSIKQTKECINFNDKYIEEMRKKNEGHPMVVVEEAKKSGCKK